MAGFHPLDAQAAPSKAQKAIPQGLATAINVALPSLAWSIRAFFVKPPFASTSARLKRLGGMVEQRSQQIEDKVMSCRRVLEPKPVVGACAMRSCAPSFP